MKINKNYFDIFERAENELDTSYDICFTDSDKVEAYISDENLVSMIEDLLDKIETLKEDYKELEQDLQDNYKPIPVAEQYDISDKDFI